jgi:hypothetical protein
MHNEAKLHGQSIGLLSMLGIQFVLGMILNLFVTLPTNHPGTSGTFLARSWHNIVWSLSNGGGIALLLHVLVAIGLLVGSLLLVARSYRAHSAPWELASSIGFIGVVVALTNGLAFVGYNQDASSFVMAMGFMTAATAYSVAATFAVPKTAVVKPVQPYHTHAITSPFHQSHS